MGETVTFTNATSGGKTPYTYAWDFDNDTVMDSTAANPTHSYGAAGTYTVTLTVTDDLGNSDSDTTSVNVYLLCDANASGSVNSVDITYVEHVILEDPGYDYTTYGDSNQSGEINAVDITAFEIIITEQRSG